MRQNSKAKASVSSLVGVPAPLPPSGVAYVIIPFGIKDRDAYVAQCLKNNTVSLRSEFGDMYRNVYVSQEAINDIVFPESITERGSMVAWVCSPQHSVPLVVGVFNKNVEVGKISEERQFRSYKKSLDNGNSVEIKGQADKAQMDVSVVSYEDGVGIYRLSVVNPDDTGKVEVFVKGNVEVHATKDIRLAFQQNATLVLLNDDLEEIAEISYKAGEGLTFKDEFNQFITTRDGKISIGSKVESAEKAVLGDTYKSIHDEHLGELETLLQDLITFGSTQAGASTGVLAPLAAGFTTLVTQATALLSQVSATKAKTPNALSEIVTLD